MEGKGARDEEEMHTERGGRNRKGPQDKRGRRWERKIQGPICPFSIYIRREMGRGGNEEEREVVNLLLNYHDAVKLYSYRLKTRCINYFVSRMH